MADREASVPPLREGFVAARSNFEQPGLAGVPLGVEREAPAQLGITVGDYSFAAVGPLHVYEKLSLNVNAVVARFGIAAIWSRDGFHLRSIMSRSVPQISIGALADPSLLPALAGTSVATPVSLTGVPSTITNLSGDAAAPVSFQWNLLQSQAWQWERGVWIPPSRVITIGHSNANTLLSVLLEVSQPRS